MTAKKDETQEFQAEVGRLLEIVTNALYSNRDVFLRELISNAADACDRLRYEAIKTPELVKQDHEFKITIKLDKDTNSLIIHDNGIGMNNKDLKENLGTIARSGTGEFLSQLSGDAKKDVNLIGQFGVGFYAGFMVADEVIVHTIKAGEKTVWQWKSDGKSGYKINKINAKDANIKQGTEIKLKLKTDADEFLEEARIKNIVTTYSNHIPFPIYLDIANKKDVDGEIEGPEQINRGAAPWTLPASKIDDEAHKEFYRHVSHGFDEPWAHLHFHTEGMIDFRGLLYIPTERPFDLFNPERLNRIKLYVKRVFITDNCEQLLPSWLRFMRGVVDSEDLPLNVSREMLQNNPVINKMRKNLIKRITDLLEKKAKESPESYVEFWDKFGMVLKEGLCEPNDEGKAILKLTRFKSTKDKGANWLSLDEYKEKMQEGQKSIYYIAGGEEKALLASPHIEGFQEKNIDVLLFTDPVDEFWISYQSQYDDLPFTSVTRAGTELDDIGKAKEDEKKDSKQDEKPKDKENKEFDKLITMMKEALKDHIGDVSLSSRLRSSPVCLVSNQFGPDLYMEKLLKQHNQLNQAVPRILEINPNHALIKHLNDLANQGDGKDLTDKILLLHDQARIVEGEAPLDPAKFAQAMNELMIGAK